MTAPVVARDNGITAARFFLALLVVVSHSFSLTGHIEPLVIETGGQLTAGYIAVLGFFGLSGYLLARSRERTPVLRFLRNRALRIMPAYWLALVFGAIAASLGAVLVGQRVPIGEALAYIARNGALVTVVDALPPAFGGEPVNAPFWTLSLEALCYLVLAFVPVRWLRPVALGLLPAVAGALAMIGGQHLPLLLAFLVGSCAYLFGLPVTRRWTILAAVLAVTGYALHQTVAAHMAVAFAALGLMTLPLRWERDLSYGVYVFAYPIQRVLELTGIPTWAMVVASIVLVLPVAWLSWTFVESRALRLRRRGGAPAQVVPIDRHPRVAPLLGREAAG